MKGYLFSAARSLQVQDWVNGDAATGRKILTVAPIFAGVTGAGWAGQGRASGERSERTLDAPNRSLIIEIGATARRLIEQAPLPPGMMPDVHLSLPRAHRDVREWEAAFHANWDVAPYFTLQPLCELCMSTRILIYALEDARRQHAAMHAHWEDHGRAPPFDANAGADPNPSHG